MSVLLKPPTNNLVKGTSPGGRQWKTSLLQATVVLASLYSQYHLLVHKVASKTTCALPHDYSMEFPNKTNILLPCTCILNPKNPPPHSNPCAPFQISFLGYRYTCKLTSSHPNTLQHPTPHLSHTHAMHYITVPAHPPPPHHPHYLQLS